VYKKVLAAGDQGFTGRPTYDECDDSREPADRRADDSAGDAGVGRVKLEVRETNDTAKRLYERFGFEIHRRLPRYYDDGEDAFVMVCPLQ